MIGIFDSGVGGLGVLTALRRLVPDADLVYVADHAFAPYGNRSLAEVEERSRLMTARLEELGCRVVTVACNTASAGALHPLRRAYPHLAFVGMEPAVKPAAELTSSGRVGVVATAATFQGELFASVMSRYGSGLEVTTAACPRWVELVEEGTIDGPEAEEEVRRCLQPMLERGIDVLVLGCTHYPALQPLMARVLGPAVRIIDPSPAVARQAALVATRAGCHQGTGSLRLLSTGDETALSVAAHRFGLATSPALLPWGGHGPT